MFTFRKSALILLSAGTVLAGAAISGEPTAMQSAVSTDPEVIEAGRKSFETNCGECHTIVKDGRPAMGPNLWGLLGKKIASNHPDFTYSDALFNSTLTWTPETLDKWIESPPEFIPDNAMPFIGISDQVERQALVAYIAKASTQE